MKARRTETAGGVVLNPRGQVLVVNQFGTSWSLPKGHLDPGEDALAAAKREILEESGVTRLTLLRDLGEYTRYRISKDGRGDDRSELKRIRMFLFRTRQLRLKPLDPHNPEARWMDRRKVATLLTHRKDREFYLSILPGLQAL